MFLAIVLALMGQARAADLIVDGSTVVLGGTQVYDAVSVINGGVIVVPDYTGAADTGSLVLVADSVFVDGSSSIVADGAGYRGLLNATGEGPGGGEGGSCCRDAGGGGGHGGDGGDGTADGTCATVDGLGGIAYGTLAAGEIDMGSAGGAAGSADGDSGGSGANGGGAIWIIAADVTIAGTISADGDDGAVINSDASGGGAGGGVLIEADTLDCSGTLRARGGDGGNTDDEGGGGGGGVVKQFWDVSGTTCTVSVTGGTGACGSNPGLSGSTPAAAADFDGDGYTVAEGDCAPRDPELSPETFWYADADGDGFGDPGSFVQQCTQPAGYVRDTTDCDDDSAVSYPGADEICDDLDNDCDGDVDEDAVDIPTWYVDNDGDGFGDTEVGVGDCDAGPKHVPVGGDCDDRDEAIFPGADESCNGLDDDCDAVIDEAAVDALPWYADADSDGFGDPAVVVFDCDPVPGSVDNDGDCDDAASATFPGATEVCDGLDNDCDGGVDEGAVDDGTWYADADGDGFGDPGTGVDACAAPPGTVANATDCDDGDGGVFPGAPESCDGVDEDCDGTADDGAVDASAWFVDGDGDGFGDGSPVFACAAPVGTVASSTDCDDGDAGVFPGAPETCDGVDEDCDGAVDDGASDATRWFVDGDGDGFGAGAATLACDAPPGSVASSSDCDDGDVGVFPGALEVCDGVDQDCDGAIDEGATDAATWYTDRDGDGYGDPATAVEACVNPPGTVAIGTDCDDGAATIFPGAAETCNDLDDDCDGAVDEGAIDASDWYGDVDGDGFGGDFLGSSCDPIVGGVTEPGDCDDDASGVNPDAVEVCDGVDQDCDDLVDNGAIDESTWYSDGDGDGFGDAGSPVSACTEPPGAVADSSDCDDTASGVFPGAPELCDGVDQDCDGALDNDALDAAVWYTDNDGDGFGDIGAPIAACTQPAGTVGDSSDCDDLASATFPGATEVCDGADNDCDGVIDEGAVTDATWYADVDGDGFGDPADAVTSCSAPVGYVANDTDCDDAEPAVFPGNPELCDGLDNDCDGLVDDGAADASVWYTDADGDGFGDLGSAVSACVAPGGTVADGTDCDDSASASFPGAVELCDGLDNDCDGAVDEEAVGLGTWYSDGDGDGFGDPGTGVMDCVAPSGTVANDSDCDDGDGSIFPGALETCDGVDEDCDGSIDEDATDGLAWYADVDADGYGDPLTVVFACTGPVGTVANDADCDDRDGAINPGADELCDGVDQDCDGAIDEDSVDAETWWADVDGDGYGDPLIAVVSCDEPVGAAGNDLDCDDGDAAVSPAGTEVCNGVDDDCDGSIDDGATDPTAWYLDLDGDGFGDPATEVLACSPPAGAIAVAGDCDDASAATFPGAPEVCDGLDNDCDGVVDEGATDALVWYSDLDGDGYGDPATGVTTCAPDAGAVLDGTDCDDRNPATNPGASEVCDGLDNDCDGTVDEEAVGLGAWYTDADGDGFGDPATEVLSCTPPKGTVANGLDCDDADASVLPGGEELCDGVDNDCDGTVDEADATDALVLYVDADGDRYGDELVSITSCAPVPGYTRTAGDCDDADATINPGAAEVWYDGVDQDCDGNDDDQDGDGFPYDPLTGGPDCLDTDATVYPGAADTWYDGVDSDCAGNDDYDADYDTFPSAAYGGTDCDDADPSTYPGAPDDPYDGVITDCDDSDEYDADGDGYDDVAYGGTDCDDSRSDVNPGAKEVWYDGIDQDCDGNDDDQDGDGYAVDVDCDDLDPKSYPGAPGLGKDCAPIDTEETEETEETGDTGDTDTDTDTDTDSEPTTETEETEPQETALDDTGVRTGAYLGGCGCGSPVDPAAALIPGALLLLAARRRR